jgi:hypothetical protein
VWEDILGKRQKSVALSRKLKIDVIINVILRRAKALRGTVRSSPPSMQ